MSGYIICTIISGSFGFIIGAMMVAYKEDENIQENLKEQDWN